MKARVTGALWLLVAVAILGGAFFQMRSSALRRAPAPPSASIPDPPLTERPSAGTAASSADNPSAETDEEEDLASEEPEPDMLGLDMGSEEIARRVRQAAFADYAVALEKVEEEERRIEPGGTCTQACADLELERRDTADRVRTMTWDLMNYKKFGFVDMYAKMFKESPYFKQDAADYLAAAETDPAMEALKDALQGSDIYARSEALRVLAPRFMEQAQLDGDCRAALRRIISDSATWVLLHETDGGMDDYNVGANSTSICDLATRMRDEAAGLLVHFDDKASFALLLDMETRKPALGLDTPRVPDLYRAFVRWGAQDPPPQLMERLSGIVDAWIARPRYCWDPPPGIPSFAAYALATLGWPGKLEEWRDDCKRRFDQAAAPGYPATSEACDLLWAHHPQGVETFIELLTHPDGQTRDHAMIYLPAGTGQEIGTRGDVFGEATPENRARWADLQARWRQWWSEHREEWEKANPLESK